MPSPRGPPVRRRRPGPRSSSPTPAVRIVRVSPRAPGEEPHAHAVCRGCGRIQEIELTELDRHLLSELALRAPDGWSVERIAYSLSGGCRRCREGPEAP